MYSIEQIKELMNDYHWKKRLIDTQVHELDSNATAQYGIESTMPRGEGTTSDRVLAQVIRSDKERQRLHKVIEEISFIDTYGDEITDDKNYHILQMIKQGRSKQQVSTFLNIGRTTLYKRIDNIACNLFEQQSIENNQE